MAITPSTPDMEPVPPKKSDKARKDRIARLVIFVAGLLLLTRASIPPRPSPETLLAERVGEPASRTVIAPFPLKIEDVKATKRLRSEVEKSVPPTFVRLPAAAGVAEAKWRALSQVARNENRQLRSEKMIEGASRSAGDLWRKLSPKQRNILEGKFEDDEWSESVAKRISETFQQNNIIEDPEQIDEFLTERPGAVAWRLVQDGKPAQDYMNWLSIRSVAQQSESLARNLGDEDFNGDQSGREIAEVLSESFVGPNLKYDPVKTSNERFAARARVPSVSIELKQGQNIISRGNIVTDDQGRALAELKRRMEGGYGEWAGRMILILGLLLAFFGYLRRNQPEIYSEPQRLAALVAQVSLVVLVGFFIAWGVEFNAFQSGEGKSSLVGLIIPVATVAILVTLLENARLGLFSVIITTLLVGIQFHWQFETLLVLIITGATAVYHVTGINRRSRIYIVCPWIIGTGALMAIGVHLIHYPTWEAFSHHYGTILWSFFWLTLNGLLSVGMALLLLPLLEDLLGITTEFKLREISTYHPLLRQLEEKAPGTYYHSLNVSALAESAAASIGANAVLVKVAAYYHDIGKIEKSHYFAENQLTEEAKKKHSKITPHMSFLIIRNHVKLGLEMAREQRLPEALHPFIPEHHGTTLMSFFYDEARAEDPHGTVAEDDFRYPGPKPQTVESAVLMLADTIEAASRSMNLVNESEIRVFVKRVINEKMIDGQFDECSLTFKQLSKLSDSFARTLRTMMHRRIAYPSSPEVDLSKEERSKDKKVQQLFPDASEA